MTKGLGKENAFATRLLRMPQNNYPLYLRFKNNWANEKAPGLSINTYSR